MHRPRKPGAALLVLAIIATAATYAAYAAGLTAHRHHVSSWAIVAFTAAPALPIGLGLAQPAKGQVRD